jgi:RNA-directed DNA polymerase
VTGYSFSTPMVAGMNFAVNGPKDERLEWDASDWRIHESIVVRLRRRIFKATREQEPATL